MTPKSIDENTPVSLTVAWTVGGAAMGILASGLLAYSSLTSANSLFEKDMQSQKDRISQLEGRQEKIDNLATDVAVIRVKIEAVQRSVDNLQAASIRKGKKNASDDSGPPELSLDVSSR